MFNEAARSAKIELSSLKWPQDVSKNSVPFKLIEALAPEPLPERLGNVNRYLEIFRNMCRYHAGASDSIFIDCRNQLSISRG